MNTSFEELKRRHKFTDDLIYLALDELKQIGLLVDYEAENHFAGLSRREVIRKVGLVTIITLPIVTGLVAPFPVEAQSIACTPGNDPNDPDGGAGIGQGGRCTCPFGVGTGNACGRGGSTAPNCKRGCSCIATDCGPGRSRCNGICG